jgi:hypothetical protein
VIKPAKNQSTPLLAMLAGVFTKHPEFPKAETSPFSPVHKTSDS